MDLSPELLARLAADLRSNVDRAMEKRQAPRVGLRLKSEILPANARKPLPVWVRDVSATGMGMLSHLPMEAGASFHLRLSTRDNSPVLITCIVRHCRKVGPDLYNIGAQFLDNPASAQARSA